MEEYWKDNDPSESEWEEPETEEQTPETEPEEQLLEPEEEEQPEELLFEEEEQPVEPPKPKKKRRPFKKKVRRVIRRFLRLPLLTRIIALAAFVLILAAIIVLLVILPKNCGAAGSEDNVIASASPSTVPESTPDESTPEPTPVPQDPTPTPFIIPALTQNIKPGDSDAAVIPYVRTRLVDLGYMEMPEINDAMYDQATVAAVKRFQYRNFPSDSRAWDGWIGPTTYELLTSSSAKAFFMKRGDTDEKLYDGKLVTKLQTDLATLGYYKATPNGTYDDVTFDAVKSFQRANSLDADGAAGLRTLQLLASLLNAPATVEETTTIVSTSDAPAA